VTQESEVQSGYCD